MLEKYSKAIITTRFLSHLNIDYTMVQLIMSGFSFMSYFWNAFSIDNRKLMTTEKFAARFHFHDFEVNFIVQLNYLGLLSEEQTFSSI